MKLSVLLMSASALLCHGPWAFAQCTPDPISGDDLNVLRGYVAYYGRPADPSGLDFWSGRLAQEGSLGSIIQDFGSSQEFTDRYGELSDEQLVTGIYQQLFARNPDAGGLNFYTSELSAGARTLQSIALDVLFGAQNADADIVANRLLAAAHFTRTARALAADDQAFDGDAMASLLALVGTDPAEADIACGFYDMMLAALSTQLAASFQVSKVNDTNDGACTGDCSLREAVAAAGSVNGRALIQVPAGSYSLSMGQLIVRGDVIITGAGQDSTTISGASASRVFMVPEDSPDSTFALRHLRVTAGAGEFGGAIQNFGTLVLDRSTVSDSVAFNGGGVFNKNRVALFGSRLTMNQAQSINNNTGFGGGLLDEGGVYGVFSSQIDGNTAPFNGAGILASGSGYIADAVFSGNQSDAIGGAIDSTGSVVVVASTFTDNTADDGGAIAMQTEQSSATIRGSSFSGNRALGLDLGGGGALFNFQGDLSVSDSLFTANRALGEGGGAIETNGPMDVSASTFIANIAEMHAADELPGDTAPGFGGAILVIADNTVTIRDATFTDNIASNSGGAIYNDQRNQLTIERSLFTGNQAQGLFSLRPGGFGGAINTEGNLTLSDSELRGNTAKESGGALGVKFAVVTLSNTVLAENTADFGGAIVNFSQGATLSITGGSLLDNSAGELGGAIHATFASQQTLSNVTVSGNVARTNGGALYNSQSAVSSITGGSISNNRVELSNSFGGGIHNDGTLTIEQSQISGNRAGEGGGGIINNLGATLIIRETDLLNNVAANGAGIAAYSGSVTIEDALLQGNTATGFGGGLLIDSASATLRRTQLRLNTAGIGGGLSVNNAAGSLLLESVNISDNSAPDASALANFGSLSAQSTTISGNCNNQATFIDLGGNSIDCNL
ncbi:MAG: CSLREA domain-containing protein [Halieaceae bacterium]|jgi:CSLREA domain-containing protein